MSSMKVHQFARGLWYSPCTNNLESSLSLGCKRLRPLARKLSDASATATVSPFDLKSFIRPESGARNKQPSSPSHDRKDSSPSQMEMHPGGTRWNPTQEQIGILEMLYRGGMRTPNAQQIEQITSQLAKYGKIEGKNVFYWFQNHKARERQKHKRTLLGLSHSPRTPSAPIIITTSTGEAEKEREGELSYKRKCMSWGFDCLTDDSRTITCNNDDDVVVVGDRTLELFPLRPEGMRASLTVLKEQRAMVSIELLLEELVGKQSGIKEQ